LGDLLYQLAEAGLTRTSRDILHFCELENIDYLVLRYLNTCALPFEEWAEEWLHDREVLTSYTREKDFGEGLIWHALA
jgi:hypothetical protein